MSDKHRKEPNEEYSASINRAAFGKERVRIARQGQDIAVVISIEDLELLEELEERLDLLERLEDVEEARENEGDLPWERLETEAYCGRFASRSVSIMRYRVRGELDGPFWEAVDAGIKRGAFAEVQTFGGEVGMGWTSIDDFTDCQFAGTSHVGQLCGVQSPH